MESAWDGGRGGPHDLGEVRRVLGRWGGEGREGEMDGGRVTEGEQHGGKKD